MNLCVLLFLLVVSACTKKNETSSVPLNETLPPVGGSNNADSLHIVSAGIFANGPYGTVTGRGSIAVQNGKYTLVLENMTVSNGPDLHVYLSKEEQPVNFIDLGKLKSTAGNQLYAITGTPDLSTYPYALMHCQQYNHLFGSTVLK